MTDEKPTSLEQELRDAIEGNVDTGSLEGGEPQQETEAEAAPPEPTEEPPDIIKSRLEPEPEPEEKPADAFLSQMKERHPDYDFSKYSNDDELMKGLVNAASFVGKRDEDAIRWRAFAKDPESYIRQWGYAKPEELQPAQEDPNTTPEYDPSWLTQVERDPETGAITGVKPGADPSIAGKLRKAQDWFTKRQMDLAFNLENTIQPLLEKERERIRQEVLQEVQGQTQAQMAHNQARDWVMSPQNSKWIFRNGDPNQGLSEQGERFYYHVQEGANNGRYNPADLRATIEYATDKLELEWRRKMNAGKPPSQPSPAAMRQPNTALSENAEEGQILDDENLMQALLRNTGIKLPQDTFG